MTKQFTVHRLLFTVRFPFSVFRLEQLMAKGESRENGKRLMVKGAGGVV